MSNSKNAHTSESCVRRLPRYFRFLRSLLINGVMRTSSGEIAEALGFTPSIVRSDLNHLEGAGQQGYGYNVKALYTAISRELGAGDRMTAVIIGGDASFSERLSRLFEGRGITVIKSFFGEKLQADTISKELSELDPEIAVIADMPEGVTPEALISLGIKGIWNMTQTDIKASVPIINLPLGDIIMSLCYEIRNRQREDRHEL